MYQLKRFRIEITKVGKDHKAIMVEDSNGDYCYYTDADDIINELQREASRERYNYSEGYKEGYKEGSEYANAHRQEEHKAKQKIKILEKKLKQKTLFYKIVHYFKK